MSDLEQKAVDVLDRLEGLATEYTPKALEMAISVARVEAAAELIGGVFLLVVAGFLGRLAWNCYLREMKTKAYSDDHFLTLMCGLASGGVGFALLIYGGAIVLNPWHWAGLFNPELFLAAKVIL